MKVRCVKAPDEGRVSGRSAWLTEGRTYHVLAIEIEPTRTRFRLVGDQSETPALFEPELFEVVSGMIPSNWVISSHRSGYVDIGPEAWGCPGFWEDYFDRKPQSLAAFSTELNTILECDP